MNTTMRSPAAAHGIRRTSNWLRAIGYEEQAQRYEVRLVLGTWRIAARARNVLKDWVTRYPNGGHELHQARDGHLPSQDFRWAITVPYRRNTCGTTSEDARLVLVDPEGQVCHLVTVDHAHKVLDAKAWLGSRSE